jgi:metal-dependent amidase/aminoacylase/carboxypeptidase family protein
MHNEPGLPVGEFATRGGAFYANVDRFVFKVTGKGAHAARPHEGKMRFAGQPAGDRAAERGQPRGEYPRFGGAERDADSGRQYLERAAGKRRAGRDLRTHSSEVQQRVKARVSEIAAGFASAFGAQIDVFWYAGPTALVNDALGDICQRRCRPLRLPHPHADLHMGGEDFAVYLQHIPGAFVSIGSASELVFTIRPLIRMTA